MISMAPTPNNDPSNNPTFREVIYPSLAPISFAFFLLSSIGVIFASAYGSAWGWFVTLLLTIFISTGIYRSRLTIEVKDGKLFVAGAKIEKKFIGQVTALDSAGMKLLRGRDANAIAFTAIRFWIKGGVKVEVKDANDPVPYWLISSKHTEKLVSAINKL
ncbi:MAG: DUF3093 family protein [Actinobacteria bacterium]|nr:DUF3093 family protein [Actinomycetota bacterium]